MHLETLSGRGLLTVNDTTGTVEYRIDIYQRGALKEARGSLVGDGDLFVAGLMSDDHSDLSLVDGRKAKILINRAGSGDEADFVVSGSIS
jgi:hypothetical protein